MKWDDVEIREGDRIKVRGINGKEQWATVNKLHKPIAEGFSAKTDAGGLLILLPIKDESSPLFAELLEHIPKERKGEK